MQTEYNNLGKYTSNDHKRREMEDNIQRLKKELNEFNEDDTITY